MSDSELNGNVTEGTTLDCSKTSSMEDLSEYTDADQSISAPTEILAEFLSSIMMKDYEKALKYCALILQYEPNNSTAKEFFPLIEEKVEMIRREESEDSDWDSSNSSSSSFDNDADGTTASYSSLEDDEADVENNVITNGNTNHIDTSISSNLNQEKKIIGSGEKPVTETKARVVVQNKTSPKKWVTSKSSTIAKCENSSDIRPTQTHTNRLQTNLDNKPSLNNPQLSIKSTKLSESSSPKNSQRNKISDKDKIANILSK